MLLQRADATGTAGRADVLNRAAAEWTCCWRAVWIPGTKAGPRWWFVWVVWLPDCSGPPTNRRLRLAEVREKAREYDLHVAEAAARLARLR